ncbi:hypothetical protein RHGRI_006996 [Rhododendron griersonianum]|uniref:Uncharacterized protein n=1 Tax=Rhododendron griersonianum TaxID=479676 RepID=A0AAV6KWC3_9ERIC|nr:hypothetical protein RHGRI_006996 [Rhododendron griersonianum]
MMRHASISHKILISLAFFIRPLCLFLNVALLAESFEINKSHIQEKANWPNERKANEIITLCDIEERVIIFSPYNIESGRFAFSIGSTACYFDRGLETCLKSCTQKK